ncbi:hypothetical protein ERHA54_26830 [Erwinia rhapontici]|nr:hypothetical protein ERHA54_26830 [Erwinia rhapontici]
MSLRHFVAIDLGASSGRVMLARHDSESGAITLDEVSRCVNQLVTVDGHQCWDLDALEQFITDALEKMDRQGIVPESIGLIPGRSTMCCWMRRETGWVFLLPTAMAAPRA